MQLSEKTFYNLQSLKYIANGSTFFAILLISFSVNTKSLGRILHGRKVYGEYLVNSGVIRRMKMRERKFGIMVREVEKIYEIHFESLFLLTLDYECQYG